MKLLSRQDFKEAVFKRDNYCCVRCQEPADSAHHIFERELFPDGGYYLDNGASLCPDCHILAETTEYSAQDVLRDAKIPTPHYPPHIPSDTVIDKWGNQILPDGKRVRGELFDTENVQKALARGDKLHLFTHYVKYPRTYHFSFSEGMQSDDKRLKSTTAMVGQRIIGSIKLDGECTTMYSDHMHARSLDSKHNFTRDEVKAFWSTICQDIPELWRVCGENMWAVHSIEYEDLADVFFGYSVWNEFNVALPWDQGKDNTLEWFDLLGITPVEKVYDGIFDEEAMRRIAQEAIEMGHEGVVYRVADAIPYNRFTELVAKVVRKNHVQTNAHWLSGDIRKNGIRKRDRGFSF